VDDDVRAEDNAGRDLHTIRDEQSGRAAGGAE
jgi:hypothetical protein